jgi:hypothetical protein
MPARLPDLPGNGGTGRGVTMQEGRKIDQWDRLYRDARGDQSRI